jgi:hypothetical protein
MPKDEFIAEDPLELVGMVMPGEAGQLERMAETIVEEYARMGWEPKRLLTMFTNPMFMSTHRVYRLKGPAYVENLIQQTCARYQIHPLEDKNA